MATSEKITDLLNGKFYFHNSDLASLTETENQIARHFFATIDWLHASYDIRALWEPARLQNITILLAYLNDNSGMPIIGKIKRYCKDQLMDWIEKNPFLQGPHYISVMECGLRIPVFFYSLKLLDNLDNQQTRRILHAMFLHAWWIDKRLSLYTSSGNHTIAESVGLVFAGSVFVGLKEAKRWFNRGIQILEKELPRQIIKDGGPAEQSFHYHKFVIDLYWLVINFLDVNNLYNDFKWKHRLITAEKFLLAFYGQTGQLPSIGDSDDGFAIAPEVKPEKPAVSYTVQKCRIFRSSGYTVFTGDSKIELTFDHGPLGMAPLYNHGHADALSMTLTINGKQILVDPGTYKYNGAPEWRQYFKGTRAHNTITIDGRDQSVQETGFIWSHPYHVTLLGFTEHNGEFRISAEHNGYAQLAEPVWHKRDIVFGDDGCVLIRDSFRGKGQHDFEINFHLHPDAKIIKQNGWWQVSNEGSHIHMRAFEDKDFSIQHGSTDPIHGWYSPCYGSKLETHVMSCKKSGMPHETIFLTMICTAVKIDQANIQSKLICLDEPV